MTVSQHSGFAGASLALTLEIHEGARLFVWDGPGDYLELVSPLPPRSRVIKGLDSNTDFVHVFVRATARQLGFADHRICAVGEVWSAVRLERVG